MAGMAGRICSRFRRARTLQLGPLTLANPLFMCAPRTPCCLPGSRCLHAAGLIEACTPVHSDLSVSVSELSELS